MGFLPLISIIFASLAVITLGLVTLNFEFDIIIVLYHFISFLIVPIVMAWLFLYQMIHVLQGLVDETATKGGKFPSHN